MKFQSRPVTVEAFPVPTLSAAARNQWSDLPPAVAGAYERGEVMFLADDHMTIKQKGKRVNASGTDWVIIRDGGILEVMDSVVFENHFKAIV